MRPPSLSRVGLAGVVVLNLGAAVALVVFLLPALTTPLAAPHPPVLSLDGDSGLQAEAAAGGVARGEDAPGMAGEPLPMELLTVHGDALDLFAVEGHPMWIVFWTTTCHVCHEEEPDLRRAYERHRDDGLVLLAINVGEPRHEVAAYARERGLPWPVALDPEGRVAAAYGTIGTPTHYFVGRDGRVVSRAFGRLELPEMERRVEEIVRKGS